MRSAANDSSQRKSPEIYGHADGFRRFIQRFNRHDGRACGQWTVASGRGGDDDRKHRRYGRTKRNVRLHCAALEANDHVAVVSRRMQSATDEDRHRRVVHQSRIRIELSGGNATTAGPANEYERLSRSLSVQAYWADQPRLSADRDDDYIWTRRQRYFRDNQRSSRAVTANV